ncbi:response regulator [Donghicola sp. XS_ASV15]|uniref:response regulator n=1 Tax=Donghicola sp. XS_ASV15 TaxID=3241295 RepID=UPI003516A424
MSSIEAVSDDQNPSANVAFLVIDDDVVDQEIVKRSFKKAHLKHPLIFANNGEEGLRIMRGEDPNVRLNEPYMVLLDLNMPVMDGFEVLDAIRKDDQLQDKVVFVLSTSDDERDVKRAYHSGISGYIKKNDIAKGFTEATRMLSSYGNVIVFP